MKKILFIFLSSLALVFSSCKKDDNPLDAAVSNVTGTWMLTKITTDSSNISFIYPYGVNLTFNSDKTFECDEYLKSGWAPYYGTWDLTNDKMTLSYSKVEGNKMNKTETYNYAISGSKLTLTGATIIADESHYPFTMYYKTSIQEFNKK